MEAIFFVRSRKKLKRSGIIFRREKFLLTPGAVSLLRMNGPISTFSSFSRRLKAGPGDRKTLFFRYANRQGEQNAPNISPSCLNVEYKENTFVLSLFVETLATSPNRVAPAPAPRPTAEKF